MSQLAQAVEQAVKAMRAEAARRREAVKHARQGGKAKTPKRRGRATMDGDFEEGDGPGGPAAPAGATTEQVTGQATEDALDSLADGGQPAAATSEEMDMANGTATAGRTRRAAHGATVGAGKRRMRAGKAARKPRAAAAAGGRPLKSYRLVGGMPETPREGTHGRAILESIKTHGEATVQEIRKDLPRSVSPLTLRKYLQVFKTAKVIRAS